MLRKTPKTAIFLFVLTTLFSGLTFIYAKEEGGEKEGEKARTSIATTLREKLQRSWESRGLKDIADKDAKEKRENMTEEGWKDRCEAVKSKIGNRILQMEENKDSHITNYSRLTEKLSNIVANLKEKGLDTSELEDDLAQLEAMIKDYSDSYVEFVGMLQDYSDNVCNGSGDDAAALFADVREKMKELVKERQAIREFFINEIRQDIKDLRQQATALNKASEKEKE